jgi:hypothetical protein
MDKQQNVEVKKEEVRQPTAENFTKLVQEASEKTGFTIVPSLSWILRDDNTWSTRVNLTVGALPKQQ